MSNIKELSSLPDLSFIENKTLQEVRDEMRQDYLDKLSELSGEKEELPDAHPDRLIIGAAAAQIYQAMQYIDRGAKQNFLKYAEGEYLDNLAAFKKIERQAAQKATTTLRFTASATQTSVIGIPGGTKVKTDGNIYFTTDNYCEIKPGELTVDVTATAYESGTASNNVGIGEVKTIVNPVGYIQSVTNLTVSVGGSEIEGDYSLTERTYNSPHSLSVAGPTKSYEFWAKQSRADIDSVVAYTPAPTEVNIVFMLKDGVSPNETDIAAMESYLQYKGIRPVAEKVRAMAPESVEYSIDLVYYIAKSDEDKVGVIQTAVNNALIEYQEWQRKIGKDINPSKIHQLLVGAGAKWIDINSPKKIKVTPYAIPKIVSVSCAYGGVEDD